MASGIADPGREAWDDHALKELEDLKVLMPADERIWSTRSTIRFFRRRLGDGVCDDLALIAAGRRHGFDAMLGAFVMDGLDTYDKFLARFTTTGGDTAWPKTSRTPGASGTANLWSPRMNCWTSSGSPPRTTPRA